MPRIIKAAEAVQDFHCGVASSLRHSIVIAAQHRHCDVASSLRHSIVIAGLTRNPAAA
jgi:hypothetical protein